MSKPAIDTTALTKLARIFSVETRQKILEQAGRRMGAKAESLVPEYPKASGNPRPKIYTQDTVAGKKVKPYKSKFKSAKQAYYVLFVLNDKIPYQRSGMLGRSITSAISDLTGSSVTVRIGTAVKSAPLVIGNDEEQAAYHKGTWWQFEKVMMDNNDAILDEEEQSLNRGIEQELKKL